MSSRSPSHTSPPLVAMSSFSDTPAAASAAAASTAHAAGRDVAADTCKSEAAPAGHAAASSSSLPASAPAPAAAAAALAPSQYADRIADALARMLQHTQHQQWQLQSFHELGVTDAGGARVQLREMLEATLQLHGEGSSGHDSKREAPSAALATKKETITNAAVAAVKSAPVEPQVKREAVVAGAEVAAFALPHEPSDSSNRNQQRTDIFGSSWSTAEIQQQTRPQPTTLPSSSSASWLKLEDAEAKELEDQHMQPAAAASSPVIAHASFAPSSPLQPFSSAASGFGSPAPLATADEAAADAATSTASAAAASAFTPRVLPKRRAADMWPPSSSMSGQ